MLLNSFKTLPEIIRSPVAPPEAPTLENYHYTFTSIKLAAPMFNKMLDDDWEAGRKGSK